MNLQQRQEILFQLSQYISSHPQSWEQTIQKAEQQNPWFTPAFVNLAAATIHQHFLQPAKLKQWVKHYHLNDSIQPKSVGIAMAGNIPLVGFHDFLAVFICGHKQRVKLSTKDAVMLRHLADKMIEWNPAVAEMISFETMLKDCDAYITTGSDNSARYFEYYFGKYPSIIRRNRTSAAVLTGTETTEDLSLLADDIMQYFGLGCRNVTQIHVPKDYDFVPLLAALKKYSWVFDHHKYRNNYDYQLAIYLMNNIYYMTNDCIVLTENANLFSPIGSLHYCFYNTQEEAYNHLQHNNQVQAIVGKKGIAFGMAQQPSLMEYADGVDVMQFLLGL
jgi:Acyl-CoA reductase (LuxC)